jgi:hypothetical protein
VSVHTDTPRAVTQCLHFLLGAGFVKALSILGRNVMEEMLEGAMRKRPRPPGDQGEADIPHIIQVEGPAYPEDDGKACPELAEGIAVKSHWVAVTA